MSHNLMINGIEYTPVNKLLIPDTEGNKIEFIVPTGSTEITVNGEHDVTQFAKANVNVPVPEVFSPVNAKITSAASPLVVIPAGYYQNDGSVELDTTNLSAEHIEKDISILGLTGTFSNLKQCEIGTFTPAADTAGATTYDSSGICFTVSFEPKLLIVMQHGYNYNIVASSTGTNYLTASMWCAGLTTYGSPSLCAFVCKNSSSNATSIVSDGNTCFKPNSDNAKQCYFYCSNSSYKVKSGTTYRWMAWG